MQTKCVRLDRLELSVHNFPARKICMIHMAIDGHTQQQIRCVIYIVALQNIQFTTIQDKSKN